VEKLESTIDFCKRILEAGQRYGSGRGLILSARNVQLFSENANLFGCLDADFNCVSANLQELNFDIVADQQRFTRAPPKY